MFIKRCCHSAIFLSTALALVPLAAILIRYGSASAQPIPDATVDTQITPFDPDTSIVEGGTTVEQNLFHSFESFNIAPGKRVFFFGPDGVSHIFSRVTGGSPSQIDGVLGTFGSTVDLFFINPNGIVFGPDARSSVRGSFIATTADGVQLGPLGQFNAVTPSSDNLLAINPSAFFFNGQTQPGSILLDQARFGVFSEKSLVLLGGDVAINGGRLFTSDGRIDIGASSTAGVVKLSATDYALSFPEETSRADIQITNGARISNFNVMSDQNGVINLFAEDINITENSAVFTGIGPTLDIGNQQVGNITIDATGDVILSEQSIVSSSVLGSMEDGDLSIGQSGDIKVIAKNLSLLSGASIVSALNGIGATGDIVIAVQDSVLLDGAIDRRIFSNLATGLVPGAKGQGGSINISAGTVEVVNGANLLSSASGNGDGGDIIINARDQVVFIDGDATSGVGNSARGNGGDISISANTLDLLEGSALVTDTAGMGNAGNIRLEIRGRVTLNGDNLSGIISSEVDTGGQGNGGNIEIAANRFEVFNGGQIIAGTEATGNAGNIAITVADLTIFNGERSTEDGIVRSSALIRVGENAQGKGGNLDISTGRLEIANGAQLNVNTLGDGAAGNVTIAATDYIRVNRGEILAQSVSNSPAGNLTITADTLQVDNNGFISTSTNNAVDSGNIILTLDELLLIRNSGDIAATAGNLDTGGNGGNINITVPFIVAISTENSDISADAFEGSGGRVNISAQGVFGIESRPKLTPLSDITASSQSGISGIVTINSLDTSFIQDELTTLPDQFMNPDNLISTSCVERHQTTAGNFTITRNNLVETPDNRPAGLYSTGSVQSLDATDTVAQPFNGDIIEPSDIYYTTDGRLVMGRSCQKPV